MSRLAEPRPVRVAILALAVLLVGCSSGTGDLQTYAREVRARPGPPLEPLPVMQQFETFEYVPHQLDAGGQQVLRRDPFSLPKMETATAGEGPRPDPNRRRELLESFALDGLSMVGTLGEGAETVALVLDPDNVVHRVKVGNHMGQNEGRIVHIADDRIDLIELVPDGAGGWLERQASVALD
jgi:type IV pilus assembly protein PilP